MELSDATLMAEPITLGVLMALMPRISPIMAFMGPLLALIVRL